SPAGYYQAVAPGTSTTFQLKVINTRAVADSWSLQAFSLGSAEALPDAGIALSANGVAQPPDQPYITPVLNPGASQIVSLKITVPRYVGGSGNYGFAIEWFPVNTAFDNLDSVSVGVAQSSGISAADVFAKSGSQPFVGGWDIGSPGAAADLPIETVSALKH